MNKIKYCFYQFVFKIYEGKPFGWWIKHDQLYYYYLKNEELRLTEIKSSFKMIYLLNWMKSLFII